MFVITGLSRFSLYSISTAAINNIGTGLFNEVFTFITCRLIKVNYYLYMFSHIYS